MIVEPFTREDAEVWADVCQRMGAVKGADVSELVLKLAMDVNWSDALAMWAFSRQRYIMQFFSLRGQQMAMRALNRERAEGITNVRARYSEKLYSMLYDERRMQQKSR